MLDPTDLDSLIRAILFFLFATLTAAVAALVGPTYDNLVVPELQTGALYPPLSGATSGSTNYLAPAAHFANYLLVNVVDPAVTLVAVGVALLYLSKALVARWSERVNDLLPRLVIAVVGANFTTPIAGAILGVAGSLYPVVSGWDGGSWQQWVHLAPWGEFQYTWDNGILAFVLSIAEFAVVFALLLAVGVRDALLAVLVVLLPPFMLLWPFRPLASIAQRAWLLFVELAFLPCVMVVPLELAVGSPTPVMLVAYLGIAVASPFLIGTAGTRLASFGFPTAGGTIHSGVSRGLDAAPRAATGSVAPAATAVRSQGALGRAVSGSVRVAGSAAAPTAAPLAVAELVGHTALGLVRHVGAGAGGRAPRPPPVRPGGAG
jgi:hypothetical protein